MLRAANLFADGKGKRQVSSENDGAFFSEVRSSDMDGYRSWILAEQLVLSSVARPFKATPLIEKVCNQLSNT